MPTPWGSLAQGLAGEAGKYAENKRQMDAERAKQIMQGLIEGNVNTNPGEGESTLDFGGVKLGLGGLARKKALAEIGRIGAETGKIGAETGAIPSEIAARGAQAGLATAQAVAIPSEIASREATTASTKATTKGTEAGTQATQLETLLKPKKDQLNSLMQMQKIDMDNREFKKKQIGWGKNAVSMIGGSTTDEIKALDKKIADREGQMSSLNSEIEALSTKGATSAGGRVTLTSPSGKIVEMDPTEVEEAKLHGYK